MARDDFLAVLRRTLPRGVPFDLFARPRVDLALFVHRVEGLERGLYLLVRDDARAADLRAALRDTLAWESVEAGLSLWRLHSGDLRGLAAHVSCQQSIAGDGCFSLGMLADLGDLERLGPALYPRLYHETGAIGQVLYLEAQALGLRGTGIGCFFDDEMHAVLGLASERFRSLYHFACGVPIEDARLSTLPAYGD
jgi:nitroreductase